MAPLTRYQIPALVMLLVGISAGVAVTGQAYSMVETENTYLYTGSQIDESDVPSDATVTAFEELSPTAQDIFLTVHDRGDEYRTTEKASNLQYDDDDVSMDGYNYVRYEDDYYNLYAAVDSGQGLGAWVVLSLGLPVALVLVVLGVVSWAFDLVKLPSGVLSGLMVVGLGTQITGVTPVTIGGGVAAMVLTWVGLTLADQCLSVTIEPRSDPN